MRLPPRTVQTLMKTLLWAMTGFTLLILVFIIVDISIKGLPQVTLSFLSHEPQDMGRAGGIFSTIVATAYITLLAILLAAPFWRGHRHLPDGIHPGRLDHPHHPLRLRMPGRGALHYPGALRLRAVRHETGLRLVGASPAP